LSKTQRPLSLLSRTLASLRSAKNILKPQRCARGHGARRRVQVRARSGSIQVRSERWLPIGVRHDCRHVGRQRAAERNGIRRARAWRSRRENPAHPATRALPHGSDVGRRLATRDLGLTRAHLRQLWRCRWCVRSHGRRRRRGKLAPYRLCDGQLDWCAPNARESAHCLGY